MAFDSGRVTFCRFRVRGDSSGAVDEAFLSILQEAAFVEHEPGLGAPDEVEAGFVTGVHLFDTRFDYEKNGFGPGGSVAMFSLRLDTHKVPAEVKRAYKKMNEAAAAAESPTGFASKREKREAAEAANDQARAELASGKYRKSKVIPLLWDLRSGTLLCGSSGNTVIEHLVRQMRQAFAVELDYLSAGTLAADLIKQEGRSRDYEDLHPSAFTDPPADTAGVEADDEDGPGQTAVPAVPWVARAVDLKDFLGNEFLMWLWWTVETRGGNVAVGQAGRDDDGERVSVAIDKALDMDCAWERTGKQTLRGENPTRLPEAADALATGKWVRKAGLIVADAEHQWELTLQGDTMTVGAASLPEDEAGEASTPREAVERRLALILELASVLDRLYGAFLGRRASGPWSTDRQAMRKWIVERRRPSRAPVATPAETFAAA